MIRFGAAIVFLFVIVAAYEVYVGNWLSFR
jgi:hypothetical protein